MREIARVIAAERQTWRRKELEAKLQTSKTGRTKQKRTKRKKRSQK